MLRLFRIFGEGNTQTTDDSALPYFQLELFCAILQNIQYSLGCC